MTEVLSPPHGLPVPFRPGFDTIPHAPIDIHREVVRPEWIDYNGHMNVAYYVLAFDHATDRFFDLIDLGADYVKRTNMSSFVLETHVTYQQEVTEGDPLRFTFQLVDTDDKRMHYYFEMFHAEAGFRAATSEQLALHVDLGARRSAAFPPDLRERIEAVRQAHAGLPQPEGVGRTIALRRRRQPSTA